MKINDILQICNGELLLGDYNAEIENFSIDTRTLNKGDMYIAINGEDKSGNLYIKTAIENGAIGCITDSVINNDILQISNNKIFIKVSDTTKALQMLAAYKRSLYNIPVIAVTGSVGKTSTKDIIASVLSQKFNVLKTEGNFNNHLGLPLTLLKLKEHTAVVVEMGMNHFGEISLLTNIAKPTICVITNIGTSHIGNLGSRENILKAKLEILEGLCDNKTVIINNDNDLLNSWVKNQKTYNSITYGIDNKSNYIAYNIKTSLEGSSYNVDINNNKYEINVPVTGTHFIYNSLCALAIGNYFNITPEEISKGISNFKLTSKRMDIQLVNDITVINDSYNASYDSMKAALEVLGNSNCNRKIAVLGDMLELGEHTEYLHKKVGEEVIKNKIDILITIGKYSKSISKQAANSGMSNIYECENNNEAATLLNSIINKKDAILFKASNLMNFSEIIDILKLGVLS